MHVQQPLDPEWQLGRQIFSNRAARRLRIGKHLQLNAPAEVCGPILSPAFSVDLLIGLLEEMTAVGDENSSLRMGYRQFYGWLAFSVGIAELNGRRVVLSPTTDPDNKYHCDPCLPIASAEHYRANELEWKLHRNQLCSDLAGEHSWMGRSHGSGA